MFGRLYCQVGQVGKLKCQVHHVGQSLLPCEKAVVPGYNDGQAVLPGGTYVKVLVSGK